MSKKLPFLYKGENNKVIKNNKTVFYSSRSEEIPSEKNNAVESDYIINVPVKIKTFDKEYICKIVGKFSDHILTTSNEIIKLNEIKSIIRL